MWSSAAAKSIAATISASKTQRQHLSLVASRLVSQPPDLIRWVRINGGFVHPNLKIDEQKSFGLSVVANGEIQQGEELIALPSHIPMRFDGSDRQHSTLRELATRIPEELWAMKLGLRLLQERSVVGSFWWPYISNLPETFTVPIFFPGEDIKNLQYAPIVHQVNKRCRFLLEFEKEVKLVLEDVSPNSHPFGGQDVHASSLGWAMSAVSSRAFRLHGQKLSSDKQIDVPMLLPLIDMCNHSFSPNARIVQEQDASSSNLTVKVVAETQIEQDAPVLLNYGFLSNDLFLLDYGFVVQSNPYDHIELTYDENLLDAASLAIGVSNPSFSSKTQWQQEILSKLNLRGEASILKITLGGAGLIDGRLLAALRVLFAGSKETVDQYELETLMSVEEEAPLGVTVEIAALRTVIALCIVALEHFPTKIMQDESILKVNESATAELAVQFRLQKKMLIIDVMRKLTQRVKKISGKQLAMET